jgi:radical SAM protein with 4Fe4S-binding SPASM domain
MDPDELTFEEARDLFDQLSESGVVDLAISGGEPLLRPDILKLIDHAVGLKFSVGVGSNGGNLSRQKIEAIAKTGITRLQLSLDGFAATHDRLRGWPGLFDLAVEAIKTAVETGLRTHVCFTINRLNVAELEKLVSFVADLGARRVNLSRYVPTGRGKDHLDLPPEDWQSAIQMCNRLRSLYEGKMEIVNHLAQQILLDDEVSDMPAFIGCQAGIGQGCITATGTVWPCVLLPIPLGNIRERSFRDIWKSSEIVKALRNRENLKGVCGTCVVKDRCGGCRAVAFSKTGDYLASDPRCWERVRLKGNIVS